MVNNVLYVGLGYEHAKQDLFTYAQLFASTVKAVAQGKRTNEAQRSALCAKFNWRILAKGLQIC